MRRKEHYKEWNVSRGIITHMERKCFLYGKGVANNNLVIIELIVTYGLSKRNSCNNEQQIGG